MATNNPEVRATLKADTSNYERNVTAAGKATDKVAQAQDALTRKNQLSRAAWAALGTGVTLVGAKMAQTLVRSVAAASDLNESASKMGVVFGKSRGEVEKFAASSSESLGMSKRAAYDAASMMALFGKSAGLTGQELVKFSTEMVQLSADLASFFNTAPEDAMQAIGSALRGEYESIRRYNVLIDDATLRQRALEMGIVSTVKNALTPQQKVLAAQAEILRQTGDAQGDFARTSDGVANSQRRMSAAIENAQASLGEALLPLVAAGAQAVARLAEAFAALPAPVRAGITGVAALTAGFALLSPAILASIQTMKILVDMYKTHKAAALASAAANDAFTASANRLTGTTLVKWLGAAAVAAGAALYAIGKLNEHLGGEVAAREAAHVEQLADAYKQAIASGEELNDVLTYNVLGADLAGQGIGFLLDQVAKFGPEVDSAKDSFAALDKALSSSASPTAAARAYERLTYEVLGSGHSVDELNALLPEYSAKVDLSADASTRLGEATDESNSALQEQQDVADKARDALEKLADSMWGYIAAGLAAARTSDELRGAKARLTAAVKENGDSLKKSTAAGRENRAAVFDEIDAVVAHSKAVYENAKANGKDIPVALKKARTALREGKQDLREAAIAAGFNKDEVKKLIDKYAEIPDDVVTEIIMESENLTKEVDTKIIRPYQQIRPAVESEMREASRAGKTGGAEIVASIRSGAKGSYSVGASIAGGVKSGLVNNWPSVDSTAVSLSSGMVAKVNRALGISSPSKVFAEVGKQVVAGLVKGLDDNKHKVRRAVESSMEKVNDALSTTKDRIRDLRDESANFGADLARGLGAFGGGLPGFEDKMYGPQNRLAEAEYALRVLQRTSTAGLSEDEMADHVKKVADAVDALEKAKAEFAEVLTPEKLLANMQGSVAALRNWSGDLNSLIARGAPRELVEELRAMGIDASAELSAISDMTDSQYAAFLAAWKERNSLAAKEGGAQYADELAEAMADLKDRFKAIGKNAMDGLGDGLEARGKKARKRLRRLLRDILGDAWVDIAHSGGKAGYVTKKAHGGLVLGPGSGTSDSVPAWLSRGEYVMRASTVRQFGADFFDHLNYGMSAAGARSYAAQAALAGGSSEPIVVNLMLDGRTVQRSLIDVQRRTGRQLFPAV